MVIFQRLGKFQIHDPVFLNGKSGAALSAAACKDFAAVSGGHSLAETVNLMTLAPLWLISAKHANTS